MDRRDMMAMFPPDTEGFDEKSMIWTFEIDHCDLPCPNYEAGVQCDCGYCTESDGSETFKFPCTFEVCGTCQGRGTHVNPSIDAHGISREEFDEDPDFRDDYMSGLYDIQCNECQGRRVVPVVDESHLSDDQQRALRVINDRARGDAEYDRMSYLERMMGA